MDLRKFIDQGVWIINTIYRYLSYTGDFSILDEVCGYYKLTDRVDFSDRRDTVLDHLTAICRYLIGNIDEETGCLRVCTGTGMTRSTVWGSVWTVRSPSAAAFR